MFKEYETFALVQGFHKIFKIMFGYKILGFILKFSIKYYFKN